MDVHVHESREHGRIAQVDHLVLCRAGAQPRLDRRDAIAVHHDRHVVCRAVAGAIDKMTRMDEGRRVQGRYQEGGAQ